MSVQIRGGQIQNASISSTQLANDSVGASQLASNAVTSAKIASSAITSAKLASGVINATSLIADSIITAAKMDLSGTFDFSSGTLQAGTPSNASDVANKSYVDGIVGGGVYWKEPAKAASTANVTISNPGTDSFDGVTLVSGDRLLLKNQTSQAENGVYDFNGSSSALTRSSDANSADELNGLAIFVKEGTANADQGFVQTSEIATLGSDNVVFVQFTGLGQITAGDGLEKSGNTLSVSVGNGISTSAGDIVVAAGAGLDFNAGDLDVQVDDSSIEINAGALRVKADGITSAMIGTNQVTGNEISAGGVGTANLADSSVSTAKLGASAVTEAKLASLSVSEAKIQNNAITASKIASAVAGDGLAGGAGSALSVNVDDASIEINADSLRVKDLGISSAKIANSAISTAKILDANVTGVKLAAAVAGNGLQKDGSNNLEVATGNGLDFNAGDLEVQLGQGLGFAPDGVIEPEVDDSTIEVDGVSGNLQVKNLGISTAKVADSAITTVKLSDDSVTAAKVGFQGYQELTTVSGSSTVNIDLARQVDSAFQNGIMAFKNGLALLNQTALGGSAANNDEFTLSVVGGVTRLSFGASLTDGDDVLVVYYA
jgi:hypothetical protein